MPYPEIVIYPIMKPDAYLNFDHDLFPEDDQMEQDLCSKLGTMSLDKRWGKEKESEAPDQHTMPLTGDAHDLAMSDSEGSTCHTDASDSSSNSEDEPLGCALLRHVQASIDLNHYPTTGGDYLEAIFIHRALFAAFPQVHRSCARCFSDIAYSLEKRAWRTDRDADTEAVTAFRHEAWMIAATMPGP